MHWATCGTSTCYLMPMQVIKVTTLSQRETPASPQTHRATQRERKQKNGEEKIKLDNNEVSKTWKTQRKNNFLKGDGICSLEGN